MSIKHRDLIGKGLESSKKQRWGGGKIPLLRKKGVKRKAKKFFGEGLLLAQHFQ